MKIATLTLLALMVMTPAVSVFPEPPQRDVPAEVDAARKALQNAHNELEHARRPMGLAQGRSDEARRGGPDRIERSGKVGAGTPRHEITRNASHA
jgi:hypothetical protein